MSVDNLKVGMYVSELDRPWTETPFLLQGFTICGVADIEEISKYCEYVYIENAADVFATCKKDAPKKKAAPKKAAKPRQFKQPLVNSHKEYKSARNAHKNMKGLTMSFMDEVALGRALDVKEVQRSISECVQSVIRNPETLRWISHIRNQDNYTAEHSLNVGLLAINFGHHLGMNEEELNALGFCGVVHDVGKTRTPDKVLNSKNALSADEFEVMKQHTTHGRDILMAQGKDMIAGAVDVAYGHHESLDGKGYPRGVDAKGISIHTRIITLCDVYDAMTSDRVYKNGRPSIDALNVIHRYAGGKFDKGFAQEFIRYIGLYPPGSIVELRTGELGVVISRNYRYRHLPKVLILRDAQSRPCPQRVIDLERHARSGNTKNQFVVRSVLPNGTSGIRLEALIEDGLQLG